MTKTKPVLIMTLDKVIDQLTLIATNNRTLREMLFSGRTIYTEDISQYGQNKSTRCSDPRWYTCTIMFDQSQYDIVYVSELMHSVASHHRSNWYYGGSWSGLIQWCLESTCMLTRDLHGICNPTPAAAAARFGLYIGANWRRFVTGV